jgi:hypothetical protein
MIQYIVYRKYIAANAYLHASNVITLIVSFIIHLLRADTTYNGSPRDEGDISSALNGSSQTYLYFPLLFVVE